MFKKRVFAALMTAAMCVAMLPISSMAVYKDKKADALDPYDKTTVHLTIGATQEEERVESNVVFVLDKSTSAAVREEAEAMLDELLEQANEDTIVNVAVIAFEKTANTIIDWTRLTSDSMDTIKSAIDSRQSESGTNIYLGLTEGKNKLDEKADEDNHLVLVTDGITYLWGGVNSGTTYSIYSEQIGKNEEVLSAGNDMMGKHHSDTATYFADFNNIATWYSSNGFAIKKDIEDYQTEYVGGHFVADTKGQMENSTYENTPVKKYIPGENLSDHYCANDAAVYMAVTAWQEILNAGYHAYAYADASTAANAAFVTTYPWASAFVGSLNTLGGNSAVIEETDVNGMFDDVKNSVLYEIDHGTVTDQIGNYFTLVDDKNVNADTFTLKVGGQEITGELIDTNTIGYGKHEAEDQTTTYDYVVTYHPDNSETFDISNNQAYFTWEINVPVENNKGIELSYDVQLDRAAAKADEKDTVYTNKDTELEYYTTGDPEKKTEEFDPPEFPVKTSEPSVDKKSDGKDEIGTVKHGETISFTLNSNLPEKLGTEDYKLTFTDTMSGLALHTIPVVTIEGKVLDPENYELAGKVGDTSFTLTINVSQLLEKKIITEDQLKDAAAVVVSYDATVIAENGEITNTADVNNHQDVIKGTVTPGGVNSGGTGTTMYTVGGAVLLLAAGALYVTTRKKEDNGN